MPSASLLVKHVGRLSNLNRYHLSADDVSELKTNLVVIVSRILTHYIPALAPFAKVVPMHIQHQYSKEMSQKSDVFILNVLMKDEKSHTLVRGTKMGV